MKTFDYFVLLLFCVLLLCGSCGRAVSNSDSKDNKGDDSVAEEQPVKAVYDGSKMHFSTAVAVKDFRIMSLSDLDFVDDKLVFTENELSVYTKFVPGDEIIVEMPFVGDTPQYAVSFVDKHGKVVKMTIVQSGYDGSILLTQY